MVEETNETDYTKWSDEQLLEKAYREYKFGVIFMDVIHKFGNFREIKPFPHYYTDKSETVKYVISESCGFRTVFCRSGFNTEYTDCSHACSNPYIYKENSGWCPIVTQEIINLKQNNGREKEKV